MENSRNFSENTVGNNAIVNQGNGNNITVNAGTSNADKSFLQEISKTDPVYDKKRILMLKGPLLWESFSWILKHQQFNEWRHTKQSGVLWIKGDPGKGKTMLLCGIVEDFEQNSQRENLSYFFCQATDYRINTAAAVVGGLIKSLLKRHPRLLSSIRENYEDQLKDQLDGANALVILCDIFETTINNPELNDVICVVDALDECIKDCRHLLSLIIKTSGRVKWLLSSRNEKVIEKMLDQVPQKLILELKQNAERISTSIDAYIKHHIHEIEALKDDEQLQAKALNILGSKAQGTFLWVALVVEQLHKTDRWDVENVLEEVPKDLESLYGLILDRTEKLGERSQQICKVLLSIVATAKRPLHLEELLVFINSHWKDSRHFKTTYVLRDIRDMAKTCGSILSIRDNTVYFIHQSAKDYLVENAAQRIFPILHQHYKMFEASLDAMSNVLKYDIYGLEDPAIHIDDIPLKDIDSDPLASIRYCCVFWVEHLVSGYQFKGFEHSKYLKDDERLHSFLKENFLCWIESLSLMRSLYPQAQDALQKLKDLIESYRGGGSIESETSQATQVKRECETHGLRQFTDDAYRFVDNSKESVTHWPLQLYFSAMCFGQDNCIIRKTFEGTACEKFGPSPVLASMRHGQSFRLQNSFYIPENQSRNIGKPHFRKLVFSPDSSLIGRMSVDESIPVIRFWRADSGTLECTFQTRLESQFAFSPNSNDFISVSCDGAIKWWSMDKKSCIGDQSLNLKPSPVMLNILNSLKDSWEMSMFLSERIIVLSPNGDLIASWHPRSSNDEPNLVIKIWDTKTTCCVSSFEASSAPYVHAAFSPNSELLVVPFNDGFQVHNAKTGAKIKFLNNHAEDLKTYDTWENLNAEIRELEQVWFAPNSKTLVTRASKWQLCLWDTSTWELLFNIRSPQQSQLLRCLAISPDSAILATSSCYETNLWSIDTGECVAKVPVCPLAMSFAPDWTKSSFVALQQQQDIIQTWFINIRQAVAEPKHTDYVFDNVIISPDSKFVASRHKHRNSVYIWSGDDGKLVCVLEGELATHRGLSEPLIFSPTSQLVACIGGRRLYSGIQIWCVTTGKSVFLLRCRTGMAFSSAAFSSDGKYLVTGDLHGEICILRIDSGQLIHNYELTSGFLNRPRSLITSISSESAYVAALWDSGRLQARIWHLHTGNTVVIKPVQEAGIHRPRRNAHLIFFVEAQISFSSDSAVLAFVTKSMAQIFDVTTGACLQKIAFDDNEHQRLLSFDPINGRILTTKSAFYKTLSWKQWKTSPRLGYSYAYRVGDHLGKRGLWILLDGKKNCYVPSNFRPELFENSANITNVAMTDCLLAILNELGQVVIIKLPAQRGGATSSIGIFYAHAPAPNDSSLRNSERRRVASNESNVGEHSNSSSEHKEEQENESFKRRIGK